MEKKFSQSYEKREDALFAKMKSRRLQRWWDNKSSKIDSDEKIWLIMFSRPYEIKTPWCLKFWIWDSEKNEIIGENSILGLEDPQIAGSKTILISKLIDIKMDIERSLVLFRPFGEVYCLIFGFDGQLKYQTDYEIKDIKEKIKEHNLSRGFIKWSGYNLFVKIGKTMSLYNTQEREGFLPKKTAINTEEHPSSLIPMDNDAKDFKVSYCGNYLILCAWDFAPEDKRSGTPTLWVYRLINDGGDVKFIYKASWREPQGHKSGIPGEVDVIMEDINTMKIVLWYARLGTNWIEFKIPVGYME